MARTPIRSVSSAARPTDNRLLMLLPAEDREALARHLEPYPLKRGATLLRPNVPITHVYFVSEGLVSLVQLLANGKYTEAGIVGREGMVGALVPLGAAAYSHEAVVQIPGMSLRMRADAMRTEVALQPALRDLLLRYVQALFSQVAQSVVCNGQHPVHKRLARWVALAADCVESDDLPLTHDLLAIMLGVRRSGITTDVGKLKRAGLIATHKGGIRILDQQGIRAEACECYGAVRGEFRRLLGPSIFQKTGTSISPPPQHGRGPRRQRCHVIKPPSRASSAASAGWAHRKGLEAADCECHEVAAGEYRRLLRSGVTYLA